MVKPDDAQNKRRGGKENTTNSMMDMEISQKDAYRYQIITD